MRSISVASIPMPIIFVDMSLPKPSGEFEWVQESWGAALRCRPLAAVAHHCFSTRDLELEGVRADGTTRLAAIWRTRWASSSIPSCACVRCTAPMCSSEGKRTRVSYRASYDDWPEADIAVTRRPGRRCQRDGRPTACRFSRRSPNRSGCGRSRRLEGHRRGRGDGRRSVR